MCISSAVTKTVLLFLTVIVLGTVLPAQADRNPKQDVPQVRSEDRVWDFGVKRRGKKLRHAFAIKNEGTAALKIQAVRLSCGGCFQAEMDDRTIPAGEKGMLRILFDTGKAEGEQYKTVFLNLNDPDRPVLVFRITGEVRPAQGSGTEETSAAEQKQKRDQQKAR